MIARFRWRLARRDDAELASSTRAPEAAPKSSLMRDDFGQRRDGRRLRPPLPHDDVQAFVRRRPWPAISLSATFRDEAQLSARVNIVRSTQYSLSRHDGPSPGISSDAYDDGVSIAPSLYACAYSASR